MAWLSDQVSLPGARAGEAAADATRPPPAQPAGIWRQMPGMAGARPLSDDGALLRQLRILTWLAIAGACVLASPLLAPMVMATLLALMSWPIVAWLRLRGVAHPLGAALVVTAMIGVLAIIVWGLAGPLGDLVDRWPLLRRAAESQMQHWRDAVAPAGRGAARAAAAGPTVDWWGTAQEIGRVTVTGAKQTVGTILVLFLMLYALLAFGHRPVRHAMRWLATRRDGRQLVRALKASQRALQAYWRTVASINLVVAGVSALMFWAVGMPYAFALGLLVGVLNFVPVLGPLICTVVLTAVSVATFSGWRIAWAPMLYLLLRVLESQVLSPAVIGTRLQLNPAWVIAAILVGGAAWGVLGALVAVPALLCARVACDHSRRWRGLARFMA
jgi:predicted PurR-regulated permease PerM